MAGQKAAVKAGLRPPPSAAVGLDSGPPAQPSLVTIGSNAPAGRVAPARHSPTNSAGFMRFLTAINTGKRRQIRSPGSRDVNMTISLAFLAPELVRAAVEGRLTRGINIERLRDATAEWSRKFEALGLSPQQ